jgi:hypothetical protein
MSTRTKKRNTPWTLELGQAQTLLGTIGHHNLRVVLTPRPTGRFVSLHAEGLCTKLAPLADAVAILGTGLNGLEIDQLRALLTSID